MKKAIGLLLATLLTASVLTACVKKEADKAFTAQNEIVTYRKVDPNKTQLILSQTGNIGAEALIQAFEEKNPDVQVIPIDITGGNAGCKPLIDWVTKGYAPDVVMSAADYFGDELTLSYFTSLSANPILENYERADLNRVAVNADIFWLPGPSDVTAMLYNKTLFEKYGWTVPQTFDEFVALCNQITKNTRGKVEPWNPNAKYSNELQAALEAFTYEELFGGLENRSWYDAFTKGKARFIGHMEPYYDVIQTLVENGILRPEHFTYSATARGKEFAAGKIAMINASVYDADTNQFDFDYMPFPTTKGELGYLCGSYSCFVGVPKKERSEKQLDAVNRFLVYFSSREGQEVYIGDSIKVSTLKDMPLNQSADLSALQPAIQNGHMFSLLDFRSESGRACNISLHQAALDMTAGTRTKEECVADTDVDAYAMQEGAASALPESVAVAERDMTVLETSFYIADAYRAAADADIGLIANGIAYRGNLMRIFAGEVTPAVINALKPRSFANDSALIKVSMTGKQLMDALNHPLGNDGEADCIYAFSGLQCEAAPWKDAGQKVLSVRLADGTAIDASRSYTVAIWAGTVDERYITETLKTVGGTFEDILTARMKADGTIVPADDGRIKLVWE